MSETFEILVGLEPKLEEFGLADDAYKTHRELRAQLEEMEWQAGGCLLPISLSAIACFAMGGFSVNAILGGTLLGVAVYAAILHLFLMRQPPYQRIAKALSDLDGDLAAFETSYQGYWLGVLDEIKDQYLYRRRSDSSEFQHWYLTYTKAISHVINSERRSSGSLAILRHHREYALRRGATISEPTRESRERTYSPKAEHDSIETQPSIHAAPTQRAAGSPSPASSARSPEELPRPLPPEVAYGSPRVIDWETLQSERRRIGSSGEQYVAAIERHFLISAGRPDLADRVTHTSLSEGDGAGYDVLSFFIDGRAKYIEVKTSKERDRHNFFMSRSELAFLRAHPADSFVYRVRGIESEQPLVQVIAAPNIEDRYDLVPVSFLACPRR